ncbi:hypothetical protein IFM89_004252 [Coptis chinensis]|uniref:RNase H type-1 domain-containing protein n=1 Tax=Coptis chinensis TaxID=261450 RepID=A0A835I9V6_9MAGN|nr:hypothetical protein IFM89_004252 [Coptis chinensis]
MLGLVSSRTGITENRLDTYEMKQKSMQAAIDRILGNPIVFIMGGVVNMKFGCYSVSSDSWVPLTPSAKSWRVHSSGGYYNGVVLQCGGCMVSDDIDDAMMNDEISHFSICHGGSIYVSGGTNDASFLNSVKKFDYCEGLWKEIPYPMFPERGWHCEESVGGHNTKSLVKDSLVFDYRMCLWRVLPNLNMFRSGAGSFVADKEMFVFGGMKYYTGESANVDCLYKMGQDWKCELLEKECKTNEVHLTSAKDFRVEWSGVESSDAFAISNRNLFEELCLQTFIILSTNIISTPDSFSLYLSALLSLIVLFEKEEPPSSVIAVIEDIKQLLKEFRHKRIVWNYREANCVADSFAQHASTQAASDDWMTNPVPHQDNISKLSDSTLVK